MRRIKSHLYQVVFISTCDVFFILVMFVFIIVAVYFHCLRARLLRVTLNINQSTMNMRCQCIFTERVNLCVLDYLCHLSRINSEQCGSSGNTAT